METRLNPNLGQNSRLRGDGATSWSNPCAQLLRGEIKIL